MTGGNSSLRTLPEEPKIDVDLARTFLAVVETGSFIEAAGRVHVTQSTVSARIKTLEERLGRVLFQRGKQGASLTPAGIQFQKHALALVRVWEHARLEIALPDGFGTIVTVGSQYSIWDRFLLDWVGHTRSVRPEIAIRAQVGSSVTLMQAMVDGTLDLAVIYTPQGRPGFEVELLFDDEIILVSTRERPSAEPDDTYVFIDWGPEFRADHSLNFPRLSIPGTYLELGSLSVQYLLQNDASGYVPRRIAAPFIETGQLRPAKRAPTFSYPVYAVFSSDADGDLFEDILSGLRSIADRL
ncbi:MAG: LysR family transcriptional regulator [Pseudomonadota bacterium]